MKKSRKIFFLLSLLFFVFIFAFSCFKLVTYYSRRAEETRYVRNLVEQFEVVLPPDKQDICPIKIDFENLSKKNPDIVAWIYSDTLEINYPVVQGKDNSEYLHRGFDRNYLYSGTLFIDSFNARDFSDLNTVIYGHNMQNGTMFHKIGKYRKQAFYDENKTIWLLTPDQNYKLLPFSSKIVEPKDESYLMFEDKDYFYDYVYESYADSLFKSDVDVTSIERIVTLSTCTYEFKNARFVLLCKLQECY
ncbi:MAG: class B sortase [Clostridia bacterium]|nr:class B sortase [Clostridia bacterium]